MECLYGLHPRRTMTSSLFIDSWFIRYLYIFDIWHCVKSVQIRSFFWSVFSRILTEYGEILRISACSVRMQENTDQKNYVFGHISHSATFHKIEIWLLVVLVMKLLISLYWEALVWRCFVKKVLLNIAQSLRENICTRVCFLIKLQTWGLQPY